MLSSNEISRFFTDGRLDLQKVIQGLESDMLLLEIFYYDNTERGQLTKTEDGEQAMSIEVLYHQKEISQSFTIKSKYKALKLLSNICNHSYKHLESLLLFNCDIQSLESLSFINASCLNFLVLVGNRFTSLKPLTKTNFPSLNGLILKQNHYQFDQLSNFCRTKMRSQSYCRLQVLTNKTKIPSDLQDGGQEEGEEQNKSQNIVFGNEVNLLMKVETHWVNQSDFMMNIGVLNEKIVKTFRHRFVKQHWLSQTQQK